MFLECFYFFTKSEADVLINSVLRQNTACTRQPQSLTGDGGEVVGGVRTDDVVLGGKKSTLAESVSQKNKTLIDKCPDLMTNKPTEHQVVYRIVYYAISNERQTNK